MSENSVIKVLHHDEIMAIIIKDRFSESGITFFTADEFSQQLAYMKHPAGKLIDPHVHNPVKREVLLTKEVLFIKKGLLRVDFYDDNREYINSYNLEAGDTILLAQGGHGFEVLEDVEMIEVKQGPYTGEMDKTKFSVSKQEIRLVKE